jgi:hypothetical protein
MSDHVKNRDYNEDPVYILAPEATSIDGVAPSVDELHVEATTLLRKVSDGVFVAFDPATLATDARLATANTTLTSILAQLSAEGGYLDGVEALLGRLPTGGAASEASLGLLTALISSGALTVAPSKPGDQASALTDGRQTVTTPGTAVALRGSLACKWVCVTALKTNTSQVNVGGAGVLATSGGSTGQPLAAGESFTVPVTNANLVYVDARVAGEGVSFTVGA